MEIAQLLQEPTAENYLEALDELVQGADYAPYDDHVEKLEHLMTGQDFRKVLDYVSSASATLMLSPVAHHYAARAATEIGDDERAGFEQMLVSAMIQAQLVTGDGSRSRPYVVSIPADESTICGVKHFLPASQQLVRAGVRYLDLLSDEGGHELAFDITRIYLTLDPDDQE